MPEQATTSGSEVTKDPDRIPVAIAIGVAAVILFFGLKDITIHSAQDDVRKDEGYGNNYTLMDARCDCGTRLNPVGQRGSYETTCRKCGKTWTWETKERAKERLEGQQIMEHYFRENPASVPSLPGD